MSEGPTDLEAFRRRRQDQQAAADQLRSTDRHPSSIGGPDQPFGVVSADLMGHIKELVRRAPPTWVASNANRHRSTHLAWLAGFTGNSIHWQNTNVMPRFSAAAPRLAADIEPYGLLTSENSRQGFVVGVTNNLINLILDGSWAAHIGQAADRAAFYANAFGTYTQAGGRTMEGSNINPDVWARTDNQIVSYQLAAPYRFAAVALMAYSGRPSISPPRPLPDSGNISPQEASFHDPMPRHVAQDALPRIYN